MLKTIFIFLSILHHNAGIADGKQFLVKTKKKNVPELGENYNKDPEYETYGRSGDYNNHGDYNLNKFGDYNNHGDYNLNKFGDYNNHIDYCKLFPCFDFCRATIKELGISTKECGPKYEAAVSVSAPTILKTTTSIPEETINKQHPIKHNQKPKDNQHPSGSVNTRDECICGRPQPELKSEISGGREAPRHEFPWIVRLVEGCPGGLCAGTLVSPRVILTAFHCTVAMNGDNSQPCDHSDGKRLAVFARHEFRLENLSSYYTIPVIKVFSPPNAPLNRHDYSTHDFALLYLKHPAKYSGRVSPICLPQPHAEYSGLSAIAAGWGRTGKPSVSTLQSPVLKMVQLTVSPKKYRHTKMFGTELSKKEHQYQDPCSGDSGGPLMFHNKAQAKYILIGTVQGHGYDCRTDTVDKFEGSDNGVWNKVTAHMEWITETMEQLGEKVCKAAKV